MNQHETKQTGAALRLFMYMILIAALLLPASATTAQAAPVQQDASVQQVGAAAAPETYTVTSTSCTGPGSITEAMAKANANPGTDTITFTPGLQINAGQCLPVSKDANDYFMFQATESVTFDGKGARLVGAIVWITSGGLITPIGPSAGCYDAVGDLVDSLTPGFIKVGAYGQDNSAITVTVRDLDMYELNSVARIEKNASLILEDLTLNRIINGYRGCNRSAIDADEGANFTARRTEWDTIWNGTNAFTAPDTTVAAISGVQGPLNNRIYAGNLNIEDSYFKDVYKGTINWGGQAGDKVNIVTSRFEVAGGINISGAAETNIVNSILSGQAIGPSRVTDHLINSSTQEMNIKASTVLFPDVECDSSCQRFNVGWIYRQPGSGKINFIQSAVGVNFPDTLPFPATRLLDPVTKLRPFPGDPGQGFTADEYTWIQPTSVQNAAALQAVTFQPNLLTNPPGLPIEGSYTLAEWATPLDPGELIDIVPDAVCDDNNPTNDGANALRNPINGLCITKDALGNVRVDANGKRNIGAVQLSLAPYLTVVGTGDGTVDLSWTKPQVSAPSTITGYELRYRATGAASWTTDPGPDTLARQVTGLTNGIEHEFEVRAVYSPSGQGPWSNNVKGTPYGSIGAPVVTATPGNGQVDLSWTKPSDGGHVIDAYFIFWRVAGTTTWTGATGTYGAGGNPPATQTTITGLTNGTAYEFAVTANALDGAIGPQGLATATPYAPGAILIRKSTAPAGGTGFTFTQGVDNSGNFTLDDRGIRPFSNVRPGTYPVTEIDPSGLGYELVAISCPPGAATVDVATRIARITIGSGEVVSCLFQNTEDETVVIEKRTVPPGGSGFTFSDDLGTPNSFSLNDAQTRTFTHVPQGDYQVTEGAMPGYELTTIDCTVEGVSVPGDLTSRTANISLTQPGGSAHCTFTNTKLGTIIMRKETLPDGAPDAFGYTISGPNTNDSGSLTDGASTQVDNAKSGTWELTESLPAADWHLGDIRCTSTLGTSTFVKDIDNLKATVELAPGDTMDCTFTNVEDETITVEKVTIPAGDTTTSFDFTGSGSISDFVLKDGEKQSFSVDAGAGPFTLTESDPSGAGYEVTEIRCVNTLTGESTLGDLGTRSVALNTQPGESQHCTFTNERHGQVVIRKETAPANAPNNIEFGFYGSFNAFSLKDGQDETFVDVRPGAYSVSEVDPNGLGYGLSGISCIDSDPSGTPSTGDLPTHTATINLDAGETVECTFTNSLPNTVSVFKTTIPPGGEGFGFGGNFGPFTLDDGDLSSFNVSQGSSYTISEDENANYDLAFILCNDASTGEFFEGDVVNRQVTVGPLDEGQQILCEFVNVQRGTVIIEKAPGAGTGYAFSGDLGDFSLDSEQKETFVELPVGQYSVTELTPPGDLLTDLFCTDTDANGVASTGDVASQTATINLDPGETVHCTFTNQPGGSVVIRKAVDSGPDGDFTFLDNIATPATFDLSDGGEQRFDNVLPGTYTVQEAGVPAGSSLANIECTDSDADGTASSTDLTEATAIIQLDPGETVECLFTNENNVVPVTLGWFLAAGNGGTVNFRWQTATETGTAGFNVLAVTEGGTVQLNRELIPSKVIDSVEPTNYSVALATDAVTFYLQEVGVDGSVTEHGPFTLGREYGAYALPGGVELSPKSWLPILMR